MENKLVICNSFCGQKSRGVTPQARAGALVIRISSLACKIDRVISCELSDLYPCGITTLALNFCKTFSLHFKRHLKFHYQTNLIQFQLIHLVLSSVLGSQTTPYLKLKKER